ncbi:hypothetical protein F5877DRAFT_70273 [Lentinula edodes]|nr:hypothetical protein F5877DRAFT_70273 [Lentinula edodes]
MILKVGRISPTLLQTYGNEPVVLVARGWWVTPSIVDLHSHMGDSPSPNLSGSDDGPDIVDYSGGQAYVIKLQIAKHSTDDSGTTVSNSSSNFDFSRSVFAFSLAAHQAYFSGRREFEQALGAGLFEKAVSMLEREWINFGHS